jgi:hypothetical protein
MEALDDVRLQPLLDSYELSDVRVSRLAPGRIRVDSPQRSYEGRIVTPGSAQIRQNLTDYLANREFRRTQRFVRNIYDESTVPLDAGSVFYLTDFWQGKPLEVTHADLSAGIANLCLLHQAAEGFAEHCADSAPASGGDRYGRWLDSLVKGARWLGVEKVLGRAQAANRSRRFDARWFERWEELADDVIQLFAETGYSHVAGRWRERREIAWNQYRMQHLRVLGDGRLATLQMADPVWDTRLYDLASFCTDLCEAGHAEAVVDAVAEYSQRIPLTAEERRLVLAYAAYPHLALRGLNARDADLEHAQGTGFCEADVERHYRAARQLVNWLKQGGGGRGGTGSTASH